MRSSRSYCRSLGSPCCIRQQLSFARHSFYFERGFYLFVIIGNSVIQSRMDTLSFGFRGGEERCCATSIPYGTSTI